MSNLEKAIFAAIKKIGRPLTSDELMVLTIDDQPHAVDPKTGRIVYLARDEFCNVLQDLLSRGELRQGVDQTRGRITYSIE